MTSSQESLLQQSKPQSVYSSNESQIELQRRMGEIENNYSRMADCLMELLAKVHEIEGRRNPTIMVVDDSLVTLEGARLALQSHGYHVVTVHGGFGATKQMIDAQPQVVLLDVEMPGLDGDKLLPSLRASAKLQDTRFVLYSSKPVAELEKLARRCGADGYIPKTKDWTAFVAAVRRFLDSRTLPAAAKHRDGI